MKFIKYTFPVLCMLCLGVTSCSDFLSQEPDERTDIDSENKVNMLLISAYPAANPAWLLELSSDNFIDNLAPHMPSNPNDKQVLAHYNYSHYNAWDDSIFNFKAAKNATYNDYDSPGENWSEYYGSIATVNNAIQAILKLKSLDEEPTVDDPVVSTWSEELQASWAEAHLLRAYSHFMLANVFCDAYQNDQLSAEKVGVPYVTDCEDVVQKEYDRGNLTDTYNKIEADLAIGLKYVSDKNYTTAPKYHFNVNAAHAFASRFYLYKRDYNKVIEHANAVLTADSAQTQKMLMDYSVFSECSSVSDYGVKWQHPDLNNNLMLLVTNSLFCRAAFGYRYSCASTAARDALMIRTNSPLWSGYICPATELIGAGLLSSSSSDYGFFSAKAYEQFQYYSKLNGTGYPHIIFRAFTGNCLLLERAEAEIMLKRYDDAMNDFVQYWNSALDSYTEDDHKAYIDTHYIKYIVKAKDYEKYQDDIKRKYRVTVDALLEWYGIENAKKAEEDRDRQTTGNTTDNQSAEDGDESSSSAGIDKTYNRFSSWDFTQNVSPDFTIPTEAIPYMNILNDFRRNETVFEGQRFLDIKRWGMKLVHKVNLSATPNESLPFDYSRAIEVPWEVLSSGMGSSKPELKTPETRGLVLDKSKFVDKSTKNNQ